MSAILSFADWIGRFTDAEYALLRHRMRGVQFMGPNIMRRWDVATAVNWIDIDDPIVPLFKQSLITEGILTSARAEVIFDLAGTSPDPPSGGGGGGVDAILASTIENRAGNGGGGPLVVSDDFNRADGPLGSNWTHAIDPRFPMPVISTNQMTGVAGAEGGNNIAYWNPGVNAFPADQYVEATVVSGGDASLVARHQLDTPETVGDSTLSCYLLRINASSGPPVSADLFRMDMAGYYFLGTFNAGAASTTWRMEVRGSTFTAYANGALATGTLTDDTYAAGQPGMAINGFSLVDNWSAGALA
jgi:hypothetical protein